MPYDQLPQEELAAADLELLRRRQQDPYRQEEAARLARLFQDENEQNARFRGEPWAQ
jgi:hypothetical protein